MRLKYGSSLAAKKISGGEKRRPSRDGGMWLLAARLAENDESWWLSAGAWVGEHAA